MFISETLFDEALCRTVVSGMCRLWSASHWCQAWCYLIVTRYVNFFLFHSDLKTLRSPGSSFFGVDEMKLKILFKIKVWRSKASRDGGRRPLNRCPQRLWRWQLRYHCVAATLSPVEGPTRLHPNRSRTRTVDISQVIEKRLWDWIFNYTQPSSESTRVNSEDSFFSSIFFPKH